MNHATYCRQKTAFTASISAFVVLIACWGYQAPALAQQDIEELARQQKEVMRQYMEAAGMSEEDMARAEAQANSTMNPIVEKLAAKEAAEKSRAASDFAANTAGLGSASVSILGQDIQMQVTKCEPGPSGKFVVAAQKSANNREGELFVTVDHPYKRTSIQLLSPGIGLYEVEIRPLIELQGNRFSWSGMADGDRGPAELTVTLNCRLAP